MDSTNWDPTLLAEALVITIGVYIVAGLLFCIFILVKGLSQIDPEAKEAGLGLKILLIPGLIAFWPFMWRNWKRKSNDS